MSLQNTRLNRLQRQIENNFTLVLSGPWRTRSLGFISLLLGFYFGSILTSYFVNKSGQSGIIALIMVIFIECIIRFRDSIIKSKKSIFLLTVDNIRIGFVYAVVLEAFKLGS